MTAYVHIGTAKTGTSSIQEFLDLNREILHKQGVHYLKHKGYDTPSIANLGEPPDVKLRRKTRLMHKINKELQNLPPPQHISVIFSSECIQLFLAQKENVSIFRQALEKLGFNDFKIIVYLREPLDLAISFYSEAIKLFCEYSSFDDENKCLEFGKHLCNHKQTLQWWSEVFGKENVIPRLFNKEDFIEGDLLKDFIFALGLEWDSEFKIPEKLNETIDLLGVEIGRGVGKYLENFNYREFFEKHFTLTDQSLKYLPPKSVALKYLEYFAPSNEWVREHYFPHKKTLFPPKDMTNYKENNHLTTMKEEYWERIGGFIVDIVDSQNELNKYKRRTKRYKRICFTLSSVILAILVTLVIFNMQ